MLQFQSVAFSSYRSLELQLCGHRDRVVGRAGYAGGAKHDDESSNSILEKHCGKWIHCILVGLFNGSITDGPICCATMDSEKACSSPKK